MTAQSLIARDATDPMRIRRLTRLLFRLGVILAAGAGYPCVHAYGRACVATCTVQTLLIETFLRYALTCHMAK